MGVDQGDTHSVTLVSVSGGRTRRRFMSFIKSASQNEASDLGIEGSVMECPY